MNESQCMARLLASAVHDMRNVLAVIRESAGLAQDLATLAGGKTVAAPGAERLSSALSEVQRSIIQGAALSEAMDFMAQAGGMEPGSAGPCDLARVSRSFCLLAARQARAAQIQLTSGETEEPVWANVPPLAVLRSLLEVFDLCASVGGQVNLRLTARTAAEGRRHYCRGTGRGQPRDGPAGHDGSPMLDGMRPGWRAVLMPWRDAGPRFFLSISACDSEGE